MNHINVENQIKDMINRRYMPRAKTNGEKKTKYVAAKVPERVKDRVADLMEQEDRTESYILNVLIEYALAAIAGGTDLFERHRPEPVEEVERRTVAKKGASARRGAR